MSPANRRGLQFLFGQIQKIFSVVVLGHRLGEGGELGLGDPAALVGDFLDTGNFQALTLLDDLDEGGGFGKGVVGAGVEPGEAALQGLHHQVLLL